MINPKFNESEIKKAIETLKLRYGLAGYNGRYMLATDVDGDLRIAPVGFMDLFYKKPVFFIPDNFVKIKELI